MNRGDGSAVRCGYVVCDAESGIVRHQDERDIDAVNPAGDSCIAGQGVAEFRAIFET